MLQLADGKIDHPVLPHLHFITGFIHCDRILDWLLKNRLTGDDIVQKIKIEHRGSQLDFVKWVIACMNKEREKRPVIIGRDYRV